jgi:N-acetylneuraminic acid mutarotase
MQRRITRFQEKHMKFRITNLPATMIAVVTVFVLAMSALAFAASGTWTVVASVHTPRDGHTATLLANGNVVIAGGENNNQALASSEVYSPTTGAWTASGNLKVARSSARALLLPNGAILMAGGCVSNCAGVTTATAELYNSVNGSWSSTGSMATARTYFGMVLLPSGKVLAAGGCTGLNANGCSGVTSKAEIYDRSTGTWSATGSMTAARATFSLTVLANGEVLAAGGINGADNPQGSAELYNPSTGKWTATGKMITARNEHTATLLASGNVIVAGGENASGVTTNKTEFYNSSTGKWTASGNLNVSRLEHTATMLPNGNVLVSGGANVTSSTTTVLSSAELYNPSTGVWTKTGSLNNARTEHAATLLVGGTVIDISGSGATDDLASCEVYTP